MVDLIEVENKLYYNEGEFNISYWKVIRSNEEILKEAIKVVKDKFGELDTLNSTLISYYILQDYTNINISLYEQLVDIIFSNNYIANIRFEDESLLSILLKNNLLVLNDEQKEFVIKEAYNDYSLEYWILRNNSFTEEEKKKIARMFLNTQEEYEEFMNYLKDCILDEVFMSSGVVLDTCYFDEYTFEYLVKVCKNEYFAKEIFQEFKLWNMLNEEKEINELKLINIKRNR